MLAAEVLDEHAGSNIPTAEKTGAIGSSESWEHITTTTTTTTTTFLLTIRVVNKPDALSLMCLFQK
jgi:hypothetical protein